MTPRLACRHKTSLFRDDVACVARLFQFFPAGLNRATFHQAAGSGLPARARDGIRPHLPATLAGTA
jgi:hypothetical protein